MLKVVQIGFKLNIPTAAYRQIAASVASMLMETPGLRGTMLFLNEEAGVAGGVCLFEDEISRDDFLSGPVVLQIREASFHRGLELKLFDLMPDAEPPGAGQKILQTLAFRRNS